jgi:hypothetical protein
MNKSATKSEFKGCLVFDREIVSDLSKKVEIKFKDKTAEIKRVTEILNKSIDSLNEEHDKWQNSWGTCNWFIITFIAPTCPIKLGKKCHKDNREKLIYAEYFKDRVVLLKLAEDEVWHYVKYSKLFLSLEKELKKWQTLSMLLSSQLASQVIVNHEQAKLIQTLTSI